MSSNLFVGETQFHIASHHITEAMNAIIDATEQYKGLDNTHCDLIVGYVADNSYGLTKLDREHLTTILEICDWDVTFDSLGNVTDIRHNGDYSHDEQELFEILAPFVTQGSYITFEDDGGFGRYAFTGTHLVIQEPRFDDIPDERSLAEKETIV